MSTSQHTTTADQLEAEVRVAMARLPKARGWDSKRVRDDEIAYIDAMLDAWNDERG